MGTSIKINLAVSELPYVKGLPEGGVQPYHTGIMELNPFVEDMDFQQAQALHGVAADPAHIELCFPTVHDPSLAPEGKHIITIDVNSQPYTLRDGELGRHQGGSRRPRDRDDRRALPEAPRPDRASPGRDAARHGAADGAHRRACAARRHGARPAAVPAARARVGRLPNADPRASTCAEPARIRAVGLRERTDGTRRARSSGTHGTRGVRRATMARRRVRSHEARHRTRGDFLKRACTAAPPACAAGFGTAPRRCARGSSGLAPPVGRKGAPVGGGLVVAGPELALPAGLHLQDVRSVRIPHAGRLHDPTDPRRHGGLPGRRGDAHRPQPRARDGNDIERGSVVGRHGSAYDRKGPGCTTTLVLDHDADPVESFVSANGMDSELRRRRDAVGHLALVRGDHDRHVLGSDRNRTATSSRWTR